MQNYVYDAKFSGNMLIVGRTGCGKTYFTQKLAINRFFGQTKNVECVSYMELKDFKACLSTAKASNTYLSNNDTVNSGFGQKANRDYLTVMDDVSGLADKSKKFASFLTVARKFNCTGVYILSTIYPEKSIWVTILS